MPIEAIDHLNSEQVQQLYAMYQNEWWSKGRQLADIEKLLQHNDLIVAFCDSSDGRLMAFARVLTDYVYKALIFDVIADRAFRGQGLGKRLMDTIVNHSALRSVQHFELYCRPELLPFYRKWGFTEEIPGLRFMRLGEHHEILE